MMIDEATVHSQILLVSRCDRDGAIVDEPPQYRVRCRVNFDADNRSFVYRRFEATASGSFGRQSLP
jgi:hypothetical protein